MFEHVQFESAGIHQLELGYTKKYRKPTKTIAQFRLRLEYTSNFTFKMLPCYKYELIFALALVYNYTTNAIAYIKRRLQLHGPI